MAPQPPQLRKNFGDRTANHFAVFVTQPFRAIDKLAVQKTHEVRTYTNFTSFRLSCGLRRSKKPRNGGNFRDRMCNCNTVARDAITIAPGQGCAPTPSTPYQRHVKTTYARFWQSTDQGDGLRSIKRQKRAQNASERLKTKKRANPCLFLKITLEHF